MRARTASIRTGRTSDGFVSRYRAGEMVAADSGLAAPMSPGPGESDGVSSTRVVTRRAAAIEQPGGGGRETWQRSSSLTSVAFPSPIAEVS